MAFYMMSNLFALNVAIIAAIIYSGQTSYFIQKLNEALHWKVGCNPLPSIGNVSLHYFAARGRAEAIRMILEDHNIPYTETRYTKETWLEVKQIGINDRVYTFGQVPAIVTSKNKKLVQSKAILQYIGRSVGLDCDCFDLEKCEQLAGGVEDLHQKRSKLIYNPDFSYKLRNDYVNNTLVTWFSYFEMLAPSAMKETDGFYFVSERLTWIDYMIFEMIESNCNFITHTENDLSGEYDISICLQLFDKFPRLHDFYKSFINRVNIDAYIKSERRLPFKIPYDPKTTG